MSLGLSAVGDSGCVRNCVVKDNDILERYPGDGTYFGKTKTCTIKMQKKMRQAQVT